MKLTETFNELSLVLNQYRAYWHFVPFDVLSHSDWPWQNDELNQWLEQIDSGLVKAIDSDYDLQKQYFAGYFPKLFELLDSISVAPMLSKRENISAQLNSDFKKGIGQRKWQQICLLSQGLAELKLPVTEWCAGKGHLGRVLARQHNQAVVSIEWQQPLCQKGTELAEKFELDQRFIHANVLKDTRTLISKNQHVVALHACGDLHLNLLSRVAQVKPERLTLSPCCYHLTQAQTYQPQSELGQSSDLKIDKSILKLAIKAQLAPDDKVTQDRRNAVARRLAYQAIRADITGEQSYRSLPSLNKSILTCEFSDFVKWALSHQTIQISDEQFNQLDFNYYLNIGHQLAFKAQKLELVRHLFRRALELWLVMDKALYLGELGYQVSLNEFCKPDITPRNLLIEAHL